MTRSYEELITIVTFDERLKYLQLFGKPGEYTFGLDRIFNQMFYRSNDWLTVRNKIIVRDNGCDLGVNGYKIDNHEQIYIHHINPITMLDIERLSPKLLDENNLISCRKSTHNFIHYGTLDSPTIYGVERHPNDTCPWKK